jgi:histidine ammonia-lyase
LRERVEGPGPDRWLSPELAGAEELVLDGTLLAAVEDAVGALA